LSKADFNIINGIGLEIDKIVHESCIEVNGLTIGILAGSVQKAVP